ncbi:hypothetical protein LTR84_008162 [Exophiala bonariae]|uniref:Uncharacterized protein n=1 Tax=Exophiala bonariae TaxID=1690606 RepID=A0AAV9MXA6_9EURO|nr:hypothetical protein LTR84_008162 [Exophiala bonariae]
MDEFAQSRGDDDLFDDEIVPVEGPSSSEKLATQSQHVSMDPALSAPPQEVNDSIPPAPSTREDSHQVSRTRPRGRGANAAVRGSTPKRGGGGGGGGGGLTESRWASKPTAPSQPTLTPKETIPKPRIKAQPADDEQPVATEEVDDDTATPITTAPANAVPRTPAVRGDRTATGGVRKPKLTEEELSAKLAEAKERSQNRAAAHARAQADAASFEERERVAEQKRAKDRVERKVMDNEREKNRQRKMAVMGGREWDAGKNEEDFKASANGRGGRRLYQPGLTPQQQYAQDDDDLKQYEWHEDRGRGRAGRGRGGRGGRGRGRGGRGAFNNDDGAASYNQQQPTWSADADFPALPGSDSTSKKQSRNDTSSSKPSPKRWNSADLQTDSGGGSWAEQVESSEAAK